MDDKDSMSPMRVAAIGLHEMYTELKAGGFTRGEAIELVAKVLASGFADASRSTTDDSDD